MISGFLRYTGVLWFLVGAEALMMQATEHLLFRRLSGFPSMDFRWSGFSTDDVREWLTGLGPQGAETVIVWHYLTFDLVFPALLGLALVGAILVLGRRLPRFAAMPQGLQLLFAAALVVPYVASDYAQNWAVVGLLQERLTIDPAAVATASSLNVTKFVSGAIPFAVIALLALAGQKDKDKAQRRRGERP